MLTIVRIVDKVSRGGELFTNVNFGTAKYAAEMNIQTPVREISEFVNNCVNSRRN